MIDSKGREKLVWEVFDSQRVYRQFPYEKLGEAIAYAKTTYPTRSGGCISPHEGASVRQKILKAIHLDSERQR